MGTAMLLMLAAIGMLLVLSAFFSGSETALTAASRARIHQLETEGDRRARIVGYLLIEKERLIGAILLGNNAVNILASSIATYLFVGLVGETGVAYATLSMTLLVLIFAEVLPKTYAIRNADRMALAVAPVLRIVVTVLSPITLAVQMIVASTLRLLGGRPVAPSDYLQASDEIRGAIDLHAREGTMRKHYRDMLRSILDLAEVRVEEVMVHRRNMVALDAGEPPAKVIEQALSSPYTRLPVWRDDPDNIIGILHAKDILRAIRENDGNIDAIDLAAILAEPWFVPDSTSLVDQLQAFRARRAHFALVVDEYGALMGLVTLEDIIEEIVGDITDEHDIPVLGVRAEADGSYVVDGTVTIRDLNRRFDWRLPDEEAATIAGLVIHEAQYIPEVGEAFEFHGFRFEVLARQRNQITSLHITPIREAESA